MIWSSSTVSKERVSYGTRGWRAGQSGRGLGIGAGLLFTRVFLPDLAVFLTMMDETDSIGVHDLQSQSTALILSCHFDLEGGKRISQECTRDERDVDLSRNDLACIRREAKE